MSLSCDSRGIEGVPIKLLIVAIVLAITGPLIFSALMSFDRARVEQGLEAELDEFVSTVQVIYTSGPGNSVTIEFDIPSGTFTRVETVCFGDVPGGSMSSVIRYRLQGRAESLMVLESPNVPMIGLDNVPLEIASGRYDILAECLVTDQDLNNDGMVPDTYVRLTLES